MRRHWIVLLSFGLLLGAVVDAAPVLQRVRNTSLAFPSAPPKFGFTTVAVFDAVKPQAPVVLATPPGETNRLFIVEQTGRIVVITNLANPTRTVFLDITSKVQYGGEQGLLGLAFHPGYATNRQFFVFYTARGSGLPDRLARFECSPSDANSALVSSEVILINQADDASNHNGGDLHFGPDGYLYVSLGDEGNGDDSLRNSQRLDKDFFSGMLRLDVDKRPGNLEPNLHAAVVRNAANLANYSVPSDNPFVGATSFNGLAVDPTKVHAEFWAVGLRNPWRFTIDPATGMIIVGDVGQGTREEVDVITKGGNYGWNYREGRIARPGSSAPPAGFSALDPVYDYPRSLGYSVTGGVVYHGPRFSQIDGAYIFADYGSGNIWSLRLNGTNSVTPEKIAVDAGISAFGIDPSNGDVLICDVAESRIKRLVYDNQPVGAPLPATLADTGAFADLATLQPTAGIVPYEINVPFWSDNAIKSRWFSVPDPANVMGFDLTNNWSFPAGTVFVKHFDLELTNGVPASKRRLETRFIVRNNTGVYGVTYRWDAAGANATLVPEQGLDESIEIQDQGATRTQVWHFPSRTECLSCHTPGGGWFLGFHSAQLNRNMTYSGGSAHQITALAQAGYLDQANPDVASLPRMVPAADTTEPLEARLRSYLAANCSQCHQPGGPAVAFFDARFSTALSGASLVHGRLNDPAGDPANRVIKPGFPSQSQLLSRISRRGPGQMPPLASNLIDTNSVQLVSDWVNALGRQTFDEWKLNFFAPEDPAATVAADPDGDAATNLQEYYTGRSPLSVDQPWAIQLEGSGEALNVSFPTVPNRRFELQVGADPGDPVSWKTESETVIGVPATTPRTTMVLAIPSPAAPVRFYRVRVSVADPNP